METLSVTLQSLVHQVGGPMAALSGAIVICAYGLFIYGTLYGPVRPNKATWFVWCVQDVFMAASAIASGVGASAILPVVWGAGAGIMLTLCFIRGEKKPYTLTEKACLLLSGVGILILMTTNNPFIALVALVTSACVGGVPTLKKAWSDPASEPAIGWVLMLAATAVNMCAIEAWSFKSGFLPVAIGTFQALIAAPLTVYGIRKYTRHVVA